MKKLMASQLLAVVVIFGGATAHAGNVGVGLNIHLGDRYRTASVREYAYGEPVPTPVVIEYPVVERIRFVYPERLGFQVAVGVPYDLCRVGNSYYLFRDGYWLKARSGRGPWVAQSFRDLPWELRRQRIERIRSYGQWRQGDMVAYGERSSDRDGDCDHRGRHDREMEQREEGRPGMARWR